MSKDKILRATANLAELRFVVVDATESMREICRQHQALGKSAVLMSEVAIGALLLATNLKSAGALQLSCRFSGDISRVQANATPSGLLRAMLPYEEIQKIGRFEPMLAPLSLEVRKLDQNGKTAYHSVVEMASLGIGRALTAYYMQSEQIRSAFGIQAECNSDGILNFAAGFLLEAFPKADDVILASAEHNIATMPMIEEFWDSGKSFRLEDFLHELAGPFPYTVHATREIEAFCPCKRESVLKGILSLGREELLHIKQKKESLEAFCHYCRKRYVIPAEEIQIPE